MFNGREGSDGHCRESAVGAGVVELHGAAEEVIGVKAAEGEVSVSDGGAIAAAIACRSRDCARGLGTDLECAGMIHPCERASACAGGVDVEHGHANGETGDLSFGASGWFAFGIKDCDVGGGSAHVEGEDAMDAGGTRDAECADNASGWTREDGADWLTRGGFRGKDAAGRLHDAETRTALGEAALQGVNVLLKAGREVGVEGDS